MEIYGVKNGKKVENMGMRGYYFAMDDNLVQKIAVGDIALKSLKIDDYPGLDIDRSCEAIHYLLCGDISDGDAPLGYVVPLTSERAIDFGSYGAFPYVPSKLQKRFRLCLRWMKHSSVCGIISRPWSRTRYIL